MSEFKYVVPKSIEEALVLIAEYRDSARVIAGGTDLLAKMKKGLEMPEVLINIECVNDLNYINYSAVDGLYIGAVTPLAAIEKSAVIKSKFSVLAQAASMMASPFLRNRATIGGNLCNAAPSADIAPALLVLGARIKIIGMNSENVIPIEEFFTGPGQTVLKPGQIVVEIQIPDLPLQSGAAYIKQKRRAGPDLAVVGAAAWVLLGGDVCASDRTNKVDMRIKDLRLALCAVAPTPIRARNTEDIIRGRKVTDELMAEAGKVATDESKPIDDARSSADYRKKLVAVLVPRAIRQAIELIKVEAK